MVQNGSPRRSKSRSGSAESNSAHLKNDLNFDGKNVREVDSDDIISTNSCDKKPAAQARTTRARNGIIKPRRGVSTAAILLLFVAARIGSGF